MEGAHPPFWQFPPLIRGHGKYEKHGLPLYIGVVAFDALEAH